MPIASLYSKNVKVLAGIFPDCRVLPMIKTHTSLNRPWPQGLAVYGILAEQIDLETMFRGAGIGDVVRRERRSPAHPDDAGALRLRVRGQPLPQPIDASAVDAPWPFDQEYSRWVLKKSSRCWSRYSAQEVRQRRRLPRHAAQPDRARIHERPGAVARRPSGGAASGQISGPRCAILGATDNIAPGNISTLDRLVRSVDLAEGFTLFFARCNAPALRKELILTATPAVSHVGSGSSRGGV